MSALSRTLTPGMANLFMEEAQSDLRPLVLVVEDDAIIRMSAIDIVEDQGFQAIEASSADEAVDALRRHPDVGIIFTDIHMPGSMNGLGLVDYVRERWPPIRFIIVSGEHKVSADQLPEGACFFAKPYAVDDIGRTLHSFSV